MKRLLILSTGICVLFAVSGCAETTGLAYPDLSNLSRGPSKGLSQKESQQVIEDLQKDKDSHKDETIKKISTGG